MDEKQLLEKLKGTGLTAEQEGDVWVIRERTLVHLDDAFPDCPNDGGEYSECETEEHWGEKVKTEYRNPSLEAALRDAGVSI